MGFIPMSALKSKAVNSTSAAALILSLSSGCSDNSNFSSDPGEENISFNGVCAINPAPGTEGTDLSAKIKITFTDRLDEPLLRTNMFKIIDNEDIISKPISLRHRELPAGSTDLECNSAKAVSQIELTPTSRSLLPSRWFHIAWKDNALKFKGNSNRYVPAGETRFKTTDQISDFSLENLEMVTMSPSRILRDGDQSPQPLDEISILSSTRNPLSEITAQFSEAIRYVNEGPGSESSELSLSASDSAKVVSLFAMDGSRSSEAWIQEIKLALRDETSWNAFLPQFQSWSGRLETSHGRRLLSFVPDCKSESCHYPEYESGQKKVLVLVIRNLESLKDKKPLRDGFALGTFVHQANL